MTEYCCLLDIPLEVAEETDMVPLTRTYHFKDKIQLGNSLLQSIAAIYVPWDFNGKDGTLCLTSDDTKRDSIVGLRCMDFQNIFK